MTVQKQRLSNGQFAKGNQLGFQRGKSGNPSGLPRGTVKLSIAYQKQLAQTVPGDPQGRTFAEVIAFQLCVAAAKGDVTAARELADRVEGKPRQALDVDMTMIDWREEAARWGISEQEIIEETRRLLESIDATDDAESD